MALVAARRWSLRATHLASCRRFKRRMRISLSVLQLSELSMLPMSLDQLKRGAAAPMGVEPGACAGDVETACAATVSTLALASTYRLCKASSSMGHVGHSG